MMTKTRNSGLSTPEMLLIMIGVFMGWAVISITLCLGFEGTDEMIRNPLFLSFNLVMVYFIFSIYLRKTRGVDDV